MHLATFRPVLPDNGGNETTQILRPTHRIGIRISPDGGAFSLCPPLNQELILNHLQDVQSLDSRVAFPRSISCAQS